TTVEDGLKQLQKAERNQKKGGMVMCATVLLIMCLVMLVLLILKEIILLDIMKEVCIVSLNESFTEHSFATGSGCKIGN
ncbi:hypothetical protein HN873_028380, partial [Arachis hypogaea]